jgi:hypothetical protein
MKVLAIAVALILAACSGSVPAATNSPGTPSPDVSPSTATETVPLASTTPTPIAEEPSWPPQPDRDLRFVPISQLTLSKDGRRINLDFVGGRPYLLDDPCSVDYAATVAVVEGVLEVGVDESRGPAPTEGTGCDSMGYGRSVEVDLDEPFTGSVWRDLTGYVHFLAPPEGLVELAGLPDGWELRAQRDVEESPTGRWERTYSPDPSLADATKSVVLYQSFDGPVNVTGGTEEQQVVVSGRPATLYHWPPTGELVLVWRLGNDGLALVAYEQQFSVDELIALAESAAPPASSNGPGGAWGPLAVVPPQEGADTARTEGTLRITDACVFLDTPGGRSLLVWPADRTTWDAQTRTITFANFDGSTVSAGDGTAVVLGGSGDSMEESGMTIEAWLARTPWVARPADSCPLESRWWVGALTR